jgi:anti-repressor protein
MNDLKIFDNTEFGSIRAKEIDGKFYAAGVDVARALEYANPRKAVIDHCKGEFLTWELIDSLGRVQDTRIIPESDIYRLIIKAADQSRNADIKAKAARFEKWIFDDVLPSIRKHGAYIIPAKTEEILNDPDTLIRLINSFREENKQLLLQIEQDKPKVLFADAITTSRCTILVAELAKILKSNGVEIGQNRLFEVLREKGFLMKRRGADFNSPTQKAMKLGLFSIRETAAVHPDGHISISKTVKVTGKGQIYFVNHFLKKKSDANENQLKFQNFL